MHQNYLSIIFLSLLALSGCFSASETAMMALNKYRLAHWVRQGKNTAKMVQTMLQRPERLLGVILIGNTFANILASAVATIIAVRWFGESGVIISTIIVTLLVLIFSEVLPKTVATRYPGKISMLAVWPIFILLKILNPLVWVVSLLVNTILHISGIKKNNTESDVLSTDELHSAVYSTQQVPEDKQQMLLRVLELESTTVEEVMVPRSSIVAIDLTWPQGKIEKKIKNCPCQIVPVYERNLENNRGILIIKNAWKKILQGEKCTPSLIKSISQKSYFIPEATPIGAQIVFFQKNEQSIAQVVDEYGEILGIVSLRDIVNAITGQWHPGKDIIQDTTKNNRTIKLRGKTPIKEINRQLQWQLPTSSASSIGGLLIEHSQALPDGAFCIKINNYIFEAIEVRNHQVMTLTARET